MSAPHPLRIQELVVRYGRGEPVISGVSIDLGPKEIVGLIGASGAGKSTLLRAVQRLVEPESGQIFLNGVELTSLPRKELREARRRLGMIFQEHALIDRLSVMENVLAGTLGRTGFWRSVRRRFAPEDVKEAFGLLDRVGLTGLIDSRCDELSGGQRQRIAIARAVLMQPRVLILDDATSSVDAAMEEEIRNALERVMAGRTTIVISHRLSTVALADRVMLLEDGRIADSGTHLELTRNSARYREVLGLEAGTA